MTRYRAVLILPNGRNFELEISEEEATDRDLLEGNMLKLLEQPRGNILKAYNKESLAIGPKAIRESAIKIQEE